MNRWHKKVAGTALFALGVLVVVGVGGTMMLEAGTGYTGPQAGFSQTLLVILIGSGSMMIGARLRSVGSKPRKMFYLGALPRK